VIANHWCRSWEGWRRHNGLGLQIVPTTLLDAEIVPETRRARSVCNVVAVIHHQRPQRCRWVNWESSFAKHILASSSVLLNDPKFPLSPIPAFVERQCQSIGSLLISQSRSAILSALQQSLMGSYYIRGLLVYRIVSGRWSHSFLSKHQHTTLSSLNITKTMHKPQLLSP